MMRSAARSAFSSRVTVHCAPICLSEQVSEKTGKYTYAYTVKDESGNTNGGVGSLDHIFANEAAMRSVTGADIWNINSVESVALEYSRYNYNAKNLYQADQFRASDHDPVIIGISASGTTGGTATLTDDSTVPITSWEGK